MESIFARLLIPDNETIRQATAELQTIYKHPSIIPSLCEVLEGSQNPQYRQYAAVLLRKRLVKLWKKLDEETHTRLKVMLLQTLTREPVPLVQNAIIHVIAMVARQELPVERWKELLAIINQLCHSQAANERLTGMQLLVSVMDNAGEYLESHFSSLLVLFFSTLDDNSLIAFNTIRCLTSMVEYIGDDEIGTFRALIAKVVPTIQRLLEESEDHACEAMELFDELVECEVAIVAPYLTSLLEFCLTLASNASLGNTIRVKALSVVSWLATVKKKVLAKSQVIQGILQVLLNVMATPHGEDDEYDDMLGEEELGTQSPGSYAAQVLDVLALNLPPEKVFLPVLNLVMPWTSSNEKLERKAALIAIAVMAEGCSEFIRKQGHLSSLLQHIYNSMSDKEPLVCNAALFAVGQFSEFLQPEIHQFTSQLLPLLLEYLGHVTSGDALGRHGEANVSLTRTFYALEKFCESLGSDVVPYLPNIIERLFVIYSNTHTSAIHVKELVLSGIAALAVAATADLLPYFSRVVEILKDCLSVPADKNTYVLQAQAIDTLGVLARAIGNDNFRPLAPECIELGKNIVQHDDPDLRRATYGMFASLSCVLGTDILPHLETIIPKMLESLSSTEGVKTHTLSSDMPLFNFEEDSDTEEGDLEEEIEGYSIENAYLEEKEDACNSIREIAVNVGKEFYPYLDDCYQQINLLTEDTTAAGIRKAALCCVGQLTILWCTYLGNSDDDSKANLQVLVNVSYSEKASIVQTDPDKLVCIAALETIEEMLKTIRNTVVFDKQTVGKICAAITSVLEQKTLCQGADSDDEDSITEDDEMAELDGSLIESAGNLIGPLITAAGPVITMDEINSFVKLLQRKLKSGSQVAERSFVIGTLSEICEALGTSSANLLHLISVFIKCLSDEDEEVRSNAAFGLGVLVSGSRSVQHFPEALQALFSLVTMETDPRCLDNICAAVCRMIMAQADAVPLDQVVPVLVANLPVKQDKEEISTIYNCLLQLLQAAEPNTINQLPKLLAIFASDLLAAHLDTTYCQKLGETLQLLHQHYPEQMTIATSSLSAEQVSALQKAIEQ
ncbi:importin-4-like [Dysidea avara]|uniref:importin-4-like n=1 Tax=Dysidea avara TaxID=196820 RepID=UPI00332BF385